MNSFRRLLVAIITLCCLVSTYSCQKETTVGIDQIPTGDTVLRKAKAWYSAALKTGASDRAIDFRQLQPDWKNYRLHHNAAGHPWISVRLKNNPDENVFLTELSIVIDNSGKAHGVVKQFDSDPYIGNSVLRIYTAEGRLYTEGIYLSDRRKLQIIEFGQTTDRRRNLSKEGLESGTYRASVGSVREIEEVVIVAPGKPAKPKVPNRGERDDERGGGGAGGGSNGNSGGGSPSVPVSPPEEDENTWRDPKDMEDHKDIIDSLQGYPCAQDLLRQLPNLKNQITKWILDEFGGAEFNLVFRAATTLSDQVDGYWYPNNRVGTMQTITLNGNMLKTASKEYIMVTMYHEALHAWIYQEELRLTPEVFYAKYPEWSEVDLYGARKYMTTHKQFSGLLEHLVNAIISYNPSISRYDAEVLSKTGVISSMSQFDRSVNQRYKNGSYGTKCLD